jgi:hypothetical protein
MVVGDDLQLMAYQSNNNVHFVCTFILVKSDFKLCTPRAVCADNNQSVAPDGPSMPPPIKKGNVGRRKTGGAGRQSVVPAAMLDTVVD